MSAEQEDRLRKLEIVPAPVPPPSGGLLARFPLPAPTGGTIGAVGQTITFSTTGQLVENVRILGLAMIRAPGITFRRCLFEGPTGPVGNDQAGSNGEQIQIRAISAAGTVTFDRCEIRKNGWRAGLLSEAPNLQMRGCHVHDNGGTQPAEWNLQHGVYWAAGGGLIVDSLIENNRTFGVQMYPGPVGAVMRHTMVRRNRKGGLVISDNSRDCLVEDCAFGENETFGLEGYNLPATQHNVARANYIWGNKQGPTAGSGIAITGSILTAPPADW